MNIQVFRGKQGCGMGPCVVAKAWWEDPKALLDKKDELPNDCQHCLEKNEEERRVNDKGILHSNTVPL